ncbi:MAG: DEAD/DEAH box helicase family protein [Chloroflexi bacterium]|nr:DEAD/DEAH box helicase family protein [Bacteroidota bacterium]MCL5110975.1 DEAD/DEAH box helicase family protein [Chloroflexota bacterium]
MIGSIDYTKFLALFHSDKFKELWPAQSYVLNSYAQSFTSHADVAVELPTGGGKTLISLLVAEQWRRSNRKVAILSANKTLARQMRSEAQALGIPAVLMEGSRYDIPSQDKRSFQRAQSVAIMNYWVYFNQHPVIDPANLVVMDDAHLAEHCLHSLYSVEISRFEHKDLFARLVAELASRFPEYAVLADALTDDPSPTTPPELLSFVDQIAFAPQLKSIIDESPLLHSDKDLSFRWARARNSISEANIYLGLNSIWIRPYIYPLTSNPHYDTANQRLYLSATIGEPADLSRRLGVRRVVKIPVPDEYAEKTFGRRLIIMPREEEDGGLGNVGAAVVTALRAHPKCVWLCLSQAEALKLQSALPKWLASNGLVGHTTWLLTSLGNEIDEFKHSSKGHLLVAGRFDGMDFSGDECRLVVLMTLPRAINLQEEFISAYLRDSGFMTNRLNQRIVQALGRCNRSDDDFGVYVLADRRIAAYFGRESNKAHLPGNMVAEIDMAQDVADDPTSCVPRLEKFLRAEFREYDQDLQDYRAAVGSAPQQNEIVDTASDEVVAWNALFASQNYKVAAQSFDKCWQTSRAANLREMAALHGYHLAKALYLASRLGEPSAREKALAVMEQAIQRGGRSSWFNRMRASLNRAWRTGNVSAEIARQEYAETIVRTFDSLLETTGTRGNRFEEWCQSVTAQLGADDHKTYQRGLRELGRTLGYTATIPTGTGVCDCLWRGVFGNSREVITFEAKIEQQQRGQLSSADVGQVHSQFNRAVTEYGSSGYTVRSVLVSHLQALTPDAESAAGGIRVVTKQSLLDLWDKVRLTLSVYRDGWSLDDLAVRAAAADALRTRVPTTGWLVRALSVDHRFVSGGDLLADWGSPH